MIQFKSFIFVFVACWVMAGSAAFADDGAAESLYVVHFEVGENWNPDLPPAVQTNFQAHSANLGRLRKEGRIQFGARYEEFGLIFIRAKDLEAIKLELDADPGVLAGIFTYRVAKMSVFYPWQE
ncbi:MAG: hypothetical protein AAF431_04390 [Pseudomonadota bacterium]